MSKIYEYVPLNCNNTNNVLAIYTNPVTQFLSQKFDGINVIGESIFATDNNLYSNVIFNGNVIVNGTFNLIGTTNFSGPILGQIRNKYSSTNDSIVLNYNPVSLTNSLHNIIIGTNSFSLNSTLLGLTSSTLIGHSILESNNVVNSELICVGNNILKVNTQVCTTSVNMGNNILQNYVGSVENQVMIGNEIFSELKENTVDNNCFIGNNICSTCTSIDNSILQQNTILGNNVFKLSSFSPITLIENNILIGNDMYSNTSNIFEFKNNTIVGEKIFTTNASVNNTVNSIICGSSIYENNPSLTIIENSSFIGNHILQNSTISLIQHSVFIGNNASSTNDTSILYRSAIGSNALVSSNYNTIIGHISTVSLPAIKVGINTSSCVGLLHVRESNYNESSNRILYVENKSEQEIMSVSATGMYLKGQFMSEYYENNSIVFGKSVLPESKIGENNVIIGDRMNDSTISGNGIIENSIMLGTKIFTSVTQINNNVTNLIIGNEVLNDIEVINSVNLNTIIGTDLLSNITQSSNVSNNVILGMNVPMNLNMTITNNVMMCFESFNTVSNLTNISSCLIMGINNLNNCLVSSVENSLIIGNSLIANSDVLTIEQCSIIGSNSIVSGNLSNNAENRTTIGHYSYCEKDNSIILGTTGTVSKKGISVGIGTNTPDALLDIKESINNTNDEHLLLVQKHDETRLFSVNSTGIQLYTEDDIPIHLTYESREITFEQIKYEIPTPSFNFSPLITSMLQELPTEYGWLPQWPTNDPPVIYDIPPMKGGKINMITTGDFGPYFAPILPFQEVTSQVIGFRNPLFRNDTNMLLSFGGMRDVYTTNYGRVTTVGSSVYPDGDPLTLNVMFFYVNLLNIAIELKAGSRLQISFLII